MRDYGAHWHVWPRPLWYLWSRTTLVPEVPTAMAQWSGPHCHGPHWQVWSRTALGCVGPGPHRYEWFQPQRYLYSGTAYVVPDHTLTSGPDRTVLVLRDRRIRMCGPRPHWYEWSTVYPMRTCGPLLQWYNGECGHRPQLEVWSGTT